MGCSREDCADELSEMRERAERAEKERDELRKDVEALRMRARMHAEIAESYERELSRAVALLERYYFQDPGAEDAVKALLRKSGRLRK